MTLQIIDENNEEIKKLSIDLPKIKLDKLPSNFFSYPNNCEIFYKPLTIGEVDNFSSGDVTYKELIENILESIVTVGINKYDLTYEDVIFIGIQRKLHAFGETRAEIPIICKSCNNVEFKILNLTDIEFKYPEAKTSKAEIMHDNKQLIFSPLTIKDFLELTGNNDKILVYAKMLKNYNAEDAVTIVSNLHGKAIQQVFQIIELFDHGIKPIISNCKNKECNKEIVTEVEVPKIISPFRRYTDDSRSEIRFI